MTKIFFIARYPCEIMRVSEVHTTAGTNSGSVTLDVKLLTGTQAPSAGTSLLTTPFNLKSTANTVVDKEAMDLSDTCQLKEDDRLAIVTSGTLTAVAGVQVTVYFKFLGRGDYK